ncbi:hypothetical protein SAMN05216391_10912 [Lachnospiraceae bacterium KHCPX20]|nr:hypothetical protein SAMN05216391_10912 [Lachnospiraceae bacterium KHCPX20]
MEIHTNRFNLDWKDTELVLKMIKAQYAKEEIIEANYFQNVIPQDYEYLKRLCKFDFTTEPQKWENEETKDFTEEYLDWDMALKTLCDMCINIFDVYYHMGIASYSPKYTEHYDIYERMILWSKERHKDNDLIKSIIEQSLNKRK